MKEGDEFKMVDGRKEGAVAFAKFDEAIHETGRDLFFLSTQVGTTSPSVRTTPTATTTSRMLRDSWRAR